MKSSYEPLVPVERQTWWAKLINRWFTEPVGNRW